LPWLRLNRAGLPLTFTALTRGPKKSSENSVSRLLVSALIAVEARMLPSPR